MKKNKYIVFAGIGLELIGLITVAILIGEYLIKIGQPKYFQAILIVVAFVVWFISLMVKLKQIEKK